MEPDFMTPKPYENFRTLRYFVPIVTVLNSAIFILMPLAIATDSMVSFVPEVIAARADALQADHPLTARSHIWSFYLTFISFGIGALCLGIGYYVDFVRKGRFAEYTSSNIGQLFLGTLFFLGCVAVLLFQGSATVHSDYSTGGIFMYPAHPFLLALGVTLGSMGPPQICAAIYEVWVKR